MIASHTKLGKAEIWDLLAVNGGRKIATFGGLKGEIDDLRVYGNIAFLAEHYSGKIYAFDIQRPDEPLCVIKTPKGYQNAEMDVVNNCLYVIRGTSCYQIRGKCNGCVTGPRVHNEILAEEAKKAEGEGECGCIAELAMRKRIGEQAATDMSFSEEKGKEKSRDKKAEEMGEKNAEREEDETGAEVAESATGRRPRGLDLVCVSCWQLEIRSSSSAKHRWKHICDWCIAHCHVGHLVRAEESGPSIVPATECWCAAVGHRTKYG